MITLATTIPTRLYLPGQSIDCLELVIAETASVAWDRDVEWTSQREPWIWLDEGCITDPSSSTWKMLYIWHPRDKRWALPIGLGLISSRESRISDARWFDRPTQDQFMRTRGARPLSELDA